MWWLVIVIVSPQLVYMHAEKNPIIARALDVLENDIEVQELLRMSNVMAVARLKYNDHGITHSRIVAGAALELFDLLLRENINPTTLRDHTVSNIDEARLVVFLAAYLHDIGNSIHRLYHEYMGALIAKDLLDRLLPIILGISEHSRRTYAIRQEVLHAIFATEYNTECLTSEAGVVTIADGLDMSEGRARIPYKKHGKMDIHAVSALSIKRVEIERGADKPIRINILMDDMAGLFQVEKVLMPKVHSSGLEDYIEIFIYSRGSSMKYYPKTS